MACPFFMPSSKLDDGGWIHPARLPLGAGWAGSCSANPRIEPTTNQLRQFCNLGYAAACPHLPKERAWDAVRFSVVRDRGTQLQLCFVCESGHRPAQHGMLEYDVACRAWAALHPDPRIQKMAECYLQSYLVRRLSPDRQSDHPDTPS